MLLATPMFFVLLLILPCGLTMPKHSVAKKTLYEDHEDDTDEGIYTPPISPVLRVRVKACIDSHPDLPGTPSTEQWPILFEKVSGEERKMVTGEMSPLSLPPQAPIQDVEIVDGNLPLFSYSQASSSQQEMPLDHQIPKMKIKSVWDMNAKEMDDYLREQTRVCIIAAPTCKRKPGGCKEPICSHRSLAEEASPKDACLMCDREISGKGYCDCHLEMNDVDLASAVYRFELIVKVMRLQREYEIERDWRRRGHVD
jgi:hypothetical protein